MKHVTLLAPRQTTETLLAWLQHRRLVHVEDAAERLAAGEELKRPVLSTDEADERIRELRHILDLFNEFGALKRPFVQTIVQLRTRVSQAERDEVLRSFDYRPLYEECAGLAQQYREHLRAIEQAQAERENLEFFQALPFGPSELLALRRARAWVGSMPVRQWEALRGEARELLAVQELRRTKRAVDVCAVALRADQEEAARVLRQHQFSERPLPELQVPLPDRLAELEADVERRREAAGQCVERLKALAAHQRPVQILLGHYEAERARILAHNSTARSRRVSALCGYIRARDVPGFQEALSREFPAVSAIYRDPTPEDKVPVSLSHSPLVRPVRFLVDMFGLPDYFSFDPTGYLSVGFLVFFGMCFGDVAYGLLLCAVAGYLARKSRGYEGLNNMCTLFFYCGISTIFFGVLTGSWAADLWRPDYLGAGNPLLWIKEHTALIDPLDQAVIVLLACLGLGVANQLYGIALKGYGLLRRGDVWGALFDAGLWLVVIPGFLILVSTLFLSPPAWLFRLGLVLLAGGGVGLVLTQGRHEKGIVAKAVTGLVSLYGIMGSYGCVSFVADALSYSRLLALGLTTSIVGMSFNIIAGLVRGVPWVGVVLFVLIATVGHLFNFLVSIIGSFVHPARLIFLEFFNRFYESGGVRFSPLSLDTETVIVEQ